MIQSIPAAPGAANERAGAPTLPLPRQAVGSLAGAANPLDEALQAFGQRMAQLDQNDAIQAMEPEQTPHEQPLPWPGEQAELPAQPAQRALAEEESAAEQWLLGMLGQQQLLVTTRDTPVTGSAQLLHTAAPAQARQIAAEEPAGTVWDAVATAAADPALARRSETAQPMIMVGGGEPARNVPASDLAATQAPLAGTPASAEARGALATDLLAAAVTTEGIEPPMAAERAPLPQPSAAEGTLRLQAPQARWGEQMLQALREHVDVQLQQKVQSATIRLDPPELGALEILLSHESGRLTVQLSAAQVDVARLLQQTSDRLRQELVAQHFVEVSVQVGADGQSGRHGQQRQGAPRANHESDIAAQLPADSTGDQAARRTRDVLVTV